MSPSKITGLEWTSCDWLLVIMKLWREHSYCRESIVRNLLSKQCQSRIYDCCANNTSVSLSSSADFNFPRPDLLLLDGKYFLDICRQKGGRGVNPPQRIIRGILM